MLLRLYNEGSGVGEDPTRSLALLRDASSQQNGYALFYLGVMFEYGRGGVTRNFTMAAKLYEQASAHNVPGALYYLGLLFAAGRGRPQSLSRAITLIQKAAEMQYAPAMMRLAEMHINGEGCGIDYSIGLFWFKKAAEQNDPSVKSQAAEKVIELEWVLKQAEAHVHTVERDLGVPLRVQVGTIEGH